MVSIVVKTIHNNKYLYLVESIRTGTKVVQKSIKYIGKKRPITKEEFESMQISHKKEDWILTQFKDELSYQDHETLLHVSKEYSKYVNELDPISNSKEKEKFLSIFIANSNSIEGSTMTPKETFEFLFNDTVPQRHTKKELFMASNLLDAWHYLEKNCDRFPTPEDLLSLHSLVNRGIETDQTLGKFKKNQNYIGDVHTTSFLFVSERIDELLNWIKKALKKINEFEVAFQSHAQFEIIHPFVDGNGRVGRLILNWILLYKKLMPLAISYQNRSQYLSALENSRRGKIEAISQFCFQEYINQYSFVNIN